MDFESHEKMVVDAINKYSKSKGKGKEIRELYKKAQQQIDAYQLFLEDNEAAQLRFEWLAEESHRLNKAKDEKMVVKDTEQVKKIIEKTKQEIDDGFSRLMPQIQEAIKVSTYIRVELDRQIEHLDKVYDENMDTSKKLRRAKNGLKTILRRAMLNKCTRFLAIITVLALIGLIVVYILKDKGIM